MDTIYEENIVADEALQEFISVRVQTLRHPTKPQPLQC
jgi:hypothetical protein